MLGKEKDWSLRLTTQRWCYYISDWMLGKGEVLPPQEHGGTGGSRPFRDSAEHLFVIQSLSRNNLGSAWLKIAAGFYISHVSFQSVPCVWWRKQRYAGLRLRQVTQPLWTWVFTCKLRRVVRFELIVGALWCRQEGAGRKGLAALVGPWHSVLQPTVLEGIHLAYGLEKHMLSCFRWNSTVIWFGIQTPG